MSSSRDGVSSYMESATSAMQTRMSSTTGGMSQTSETTAASYEAAITGGTSDTGVETRTARVALENDPGKPAFVKTIEGCSVERK